MEMVELAQSIVETNLLNEGVVDCDELQKLISALQNIKKIAKEEFETLKKIKKEKETEKSKENGLTYWNSLKVGDPIKWKGSKGVICVGVKANTKEGAKRLHVKLNELPVGSTRLDRYITYEKIIVE